MRIRAFAVVSLALFAVPLAAFAQDVGQPLTTGVPWMDKTIAILAAVGAICSLLSHVVSPDSMPGKIVSWMALNFGKALKKTPPSNVSIFIVGSFLLFGAAARAQDGAITTGLNAPSPVKIALGDAVLHIDANGGVSTQIVEVRPTIDERFNGVAVKVPNIDSGALFVAHKLASGATFYIGGQVNEDATPVGAADAGTPAAAQASISSGPASRTGTLADVAPSNDPAPAPPKFGGCNKVGLFCWGPQVSVGLVRYDFKSSNFSAGFTPGFGYGVTFYTGRSYEIGLAGYASVTTATSTSPSAGSFSIVGSFAQYLRLGAGVDIIGGQKTGFLLGGLGTSFGSL